MDHGGKILKFTEINDGLYKNVKRHVLTSDCSEQSPPRDPGKNTEKDIYIPLLVQQTTKSFLLI